MNWGTVDVGIVGPAFVAGLLVLATHVPLGMQVLERGIVFVDLAVAQIAGLGVIVATTLGWPAHGPGVQIAAVTAALAGALLLGLTDRRAGRFQEALIGVSFVLAASAGVLLLASNPHAGEHLQDLLVGQILWVDADHLAWLAAVSAAVLAVWFGARARLGRLGFYALFAIAVTVAVQVVGVYLVFSSLIIPALATQRMAGRARLAAGYAVGAAGYAAGLAASALADLPSGAVIVWGLAVAGSVAALVARPRATR